MIRKQPFWKLFEPYHLGPLLVKNRIIMPPMVTRYADPEGMVTERIIDYYKARAEGGVGLIIVEAAFVDNKGKSFQNQLGVSDKRFIPGLTKLVEAIHNNGTKVVLQLHHGGRHAKRNLPGVRLVAPSPLPGPEGSVPDELNICQISELVGSFANAAVRAQMAGFDGVEIHAATHYLIAQFLSAFSNRRRDDYGGNIENRARFLVEIIQSVQAVTMSGFAIWCRINGKEYDIENGITLEESQVIARMSQEAGAEAIHVSAYGPVSSFFGTPSLLQSGAFPLIPGNNIPLAQGIKKMVCVPVIACGGINVEVGEKILEEGSVDFIAMGRALLADPLLPNKVLSGRLEDIRPCILCLNCRDDLYLNDAGIRCSVNPALGKEKECKIEPARIKKKVLVVGGGPAGMEAAKIASFRGHEVVLCEREDKLGGQLIPGAIPPGKSPIGNLSSYYKYQLEKSKIRLELCKEVNRKGIETINPDILILASGVTYVTPEILGIESNTVVNAIDILQMKNLPGKNFFVVGAELVGCETAEWLAEKGANVTLARRGPQIALGISDRSRDFLLANLKMRGVKLLTNVTYEKITSDGIEIKINGQNKTIIKADCIVLAAGSFPNRNLLEEINDLHLETYLVGDCVKPRRIREAIAEGFYVGSSI